MANIIPGMVHLYVGDGKGKTTAAIGLAVRAQGAGRRVLIAQFLKGQDSSEREPLRRLGIDLIRTEELKKFVSQMDDAERAEAKVVCNRCLDTVSEMLLAGRYDFVVLDEVVDAVNCGLIDSARLLTVLATRGEGVELVMT
ncbi:MAG: cob(I)yrinic acid a,c-diamide adenosyltransferase, partial [Oscillospiraceae bacterium]